MGPGTGKRLAQQILGEHSDISLAPFAIDRFTGAAFAAVPSFSSASTIAQH